ncbi:MAG: NfeD family protein [Proteobacteria bacterium]|nr:NfeD family protein [Pseudomonadota bacterium]
MEWWLWCILGCVLLMLELVVPGGFFFLFFGLGALLTGVLVELGVVSADWAQWIVFGVGSLALMVALRAKFRSFFERVAQESKDIDGMVGMVGDALGDIAGGEVGRVELRGAHWSARNVAEVTIAAGQRCVVQSVDGLVLMVRPE